MASSIAPTPLIGQLGPLVTDCNNLAFLLKRTDVQLRGRKTSRSSDSSNTSVRPLKGSVMVLSLITPGIVIVRYRDKMVRTILIAGTSPDSILSRREPGMIRGSPLLVATLISLTEFGCPERDFITRR